MGYKPDIAQNGSLVLEALKKQQYDVILMDIQMPELDGLEATRLIRQSVTHQPYIIALTANAMSGDKDDCLSAGMNDYIAKPIRNTEIITKLRVASDFLLHQKKEHKR